jgi:hypothetical protein
VSAPLSDSAAEFAATERGARRSALSKFEPCKTESLRVRDGFRSITRLPREQPVRNRELRRARPKVRNALAA